MFYTQSTAKGLIRAKKNVPLSETVQILPRYDLRGWLGVRNQLSYLILSYLIYLSIYLSVNLFIYLSIWFTTTYSIVEGLRNLVEMKLNEPGRQRLGRWKPDWQSQHAKLALYSDLLLAQKEGTFDSPGLPPREGGGGLISASVVPYPTAGIGEGGGGGEG